MRIIVCSLAILVIVMGWGCGADSTSSLDYNPTTIVTASVPDIKRWLKKDADGHYLMSQFLILRYKRLTRKEVYAIFGLPTDSYEHLLYWDGVNSDRPGVFVIEDRPNGPRDGTPTGTICYLIAQWEDGNDALALGLQVKGEPH